MSEITEEEKEEARRRGKEYERTVDCVVDTVSSRGTNGFYRSSENGVHLMYVKDGSYVYDASSNMGTLVHEQKHRDNQMQGMYAYPVSAEQAYQLSMHDEISANMASLIALRQKYLETGDISVFDGYGSKFSYYREAIEKGEINPNSPHKEDFDKEMRLIVNGTQKMWLEKHAISDTYLKSNSAHASLYGDSEGKYAAYWDENYQKSMKIAYNIGGVDFTKYMDKDVEIPEQGKAMMRGDFAAYTGGIEAYNPDGPHTYEIFDEHSDNGIRTFSADNAEEYYAHVLDNSPKAQAFIRGLPAYDGHMSMEQYHKYLQHYLTIQEFQKETKFGDLQKLAQESGKNIEEIYQEKYNEAFTKVQEEYGALIDIAADKAAIDWNHRLETGQGWHPIPSNESGQIDYDNAVKELYNKPETCIIKSCDEDSMRPLPKYAQSVNDKANGIEPGLWDRFKDKVKSFGVETKVRDLTANEDIEIGFWAGLKSKVSGWFKSDDKSAEEPQKRVDNEITNEVNTNAPEYPEWKDEEGQRVSDIQYQTIPDLTKPIIKTPGRSLAFHRDVKIEQKNPIKAQFDKQRDSSSSGDALVHTYQNAKIQCFDNRDGSFSEVAVIDGKKHGAEITYNKDGTIGNIKLYNLGTEIDLTKHSLEIKRDMVDGIEYQCVLLDGQPFGMETYANNELKGLTVTFYEIGGAMYRSLNSNIAYSLQDSRYVLAQSLAQQKGELTDNAVVQSQSRRYDMRTEQREKAKAKAKGNTSKSQTAKSKTMADNQILADNAQAQR